MLQERAGPDTKKPPQGWKNHRGNVVDGKPDGHARGDVPGIPNLLEIGINGDGKIEKNMI